MKNHPSIPKGIAYQCGFVSVEIIHYLQSGKGKQFLIQAVKDLLAKLEDKN